MGYIGTVGKRLTLEATYNKTFEFHGYYGNSYMHLFTDSEGNQLVWKTTNYVVEINNGKENPKLKGVTEFIRKGSVVEITATVKEHSEYKDIEQTLITRCKFKVIQAAKTFDEIQQEKLDAQLKSISEGDSVIEMLYKNYKEHYSDCETLINSFQSETKLIKVIVRNGRMKASGVRGKTFHWYKFSGIEKDTEKTIRVTIKAVCKDNAVKNLLKNYPECVWNID